MGSLGFSCQDTKLIVYIIVGKYQSLHVKLVQLHDKMSIAMGVGLTTYHLKGTNIVPRNCVVLKEQPCFFQIWAILSRFWVCI